MEEGARHRKAESTLEEPPRRQGGCADDALGPRPGLLDVVLPAVRTSGSLMNALSLSVSRLSVGTGRVEWKMSRASVTSPCSQTNRGKPLVQPLAMPVGTKLCTKLPAITLLEWVTRSPSK